MKENDIESGGRAVVRFGEPPETGGAAPSRKTMTTKEVAEALGCNSETIKGHIRALFPELMENGKITYLNEVQVTLILERMKQVADFAHHVTGGDAATYNSGIVGSETPQSRAVRIDLLHRQIEAEMQAEIDEQKARAECAEGKLSIVEPKAETLDKITATDSDISVRELAAILAVPHLGQNKLFQRLRADGYLDAMNRPYRQYIEGGLMYEKEYYVPQLDATKQQLRITQKGVAYFAHKYASSRMPQKGMGMSELRLSREATT